MEGNAGAGITQLLSAAQHGDLAARERVFAVLDKELRHLAQCQLAGDGARRYLQPTTLVNEAYLRLFGRGTNSEGRSGNAEKRHAGPAADSGGSGDDGTGVASAEGNGDGEWANRTAFFGAAANVMRQICVDDARRRSRHKRGGGRTALEFDETLAGEIQRGWGVGGAAADHDPLRDELILAVDEALKKLKEIDPRQVQIVEQRYFVGMSVDETAAALGVSPRTVDTDLRLARAWLKRELSKGDTRA